MSDSYTLGVILCAAGHSTRMGTDKIGYLLGGKPTYRWAAETFLADPHTVRLVLAVPADKMDQFPVWDPRIVLCAGGSSRQETVANAARLVGDVDLIAVHDGARPFVTGELIAAVSAAALEAGAALPYLPVTDTIHIAENGYAVAVTDRASLAAAQTPQTFTNSVFREIIALAESGRVVLTDECSAAIACGHPCRLVLGDRKNKKLTTPEDLTAAEQLAAQFQSR